MVPRAPGPLPEQVEFDCRWEQKVDRLEQDLSPVAIEANTDPLRSMDPVFEPLSLARGAQAEVFSPTEADAKFVSNKPVSSSELISVTAEGTAGSTINPDLTGLLDNKDAIRILTDSSGSLVIPQSPCLLGSTRCLIPLKHRSWISAS